ncbi:MAG: hypothetical protein ABIR39_19015 [Nocardioides sp.]|uniref:hypothetical protein n=1 Tax=Nocardioides sp. TaxID=35761 RepID=UPI003266E928
MKTWILLAFLAGLFSVMGMVLTVAALVTSEWALLGGLVFLTVGLVMAWFVPAARREQNASLAGDVPMSPGTVPFERVAELIRERLAGSPYTVELQGRMIRIHADLADAEFLGWASAHKVKVVRGLEVVASRPGVAITRDFEQDLDLSVGAGRLTGRARVQSGRSWSYERRIEVGLGKDGTIGRQVDVRFSSKKLHDPVNAVLKETGWYSGFWTSLPAESKGALIVAVFAGVGSVVAVVVLGVAALLGKF